MKLSAQRWDAIGHGSGRRIVPEFVSFDESVEFDDLVVRIEPELRRFVSRKVPPAAVDDLLQEVWIAAWQSLSTFDRRAKLRTWVYGICVHKCHDHYRRHEAEARFIPLDALSIVDDHPSPERIAVQGDTVNRLLAEVAEESRIVLELYYYAGLTLAEVATILERNLNTVKYQFYRAHATMLAMGEREDLR